MRTAHGAALAELQRSIFAGAEHLDPDDADELVRGIVSHLRAWRPESVSPLGALPRPEAPIIDPRTRTAP